MRWGAQSLFQCSTNDSIALLRAFTELNVPHRISFRVMMPFQISIWFIHDAPVGHEVEDDSPPLLGEPFLGFLRQVHGSVVEDDMDFLAGVGCDDLLHENPASRACGPVT